MNSLDDLLRQAAGGDPVPDPTPDPTPDPVPDPTPDPVPDPVPTPTPDPTPPADKDKPNPIKEVRERLNAEQKAREKIDKTITRFTTGEYGFKLRDYKTEEGKIDYDAVIKAMDDADTKTKADSKGISPEVQEEIDRIDKEKLEIQKDKLRVSMDRALTNMQLDLNIKSADVNQFFKDALALKKNPYQWLAQGGDIQDLYYFVYRNKLEQDKINTAVQEAKAKWDADMVKQNRAPLSNPAPTPKPTSTSNPTGLSMEQLLQEAATKKK